MAILIAQRIRQLLAKESGLGEETFACLYQQQLDSVFNYVRYRLGPDEAEDVTADIFTRVWSRRHQYNVRTGAPATWLWAIARNVVTDQLRRRQWAQIGLSEELAGSDDPSAEVARKEEWRRLQMAMDRLPAVDQEIIALRFGAGHTNRSIAGMIGLSEANVAQRLRRGLRKMRTYLQGVDKI
jgi:RNA polymerase sigma-70 factor (ECF subfamily)